VIPDPESRFAASEAARAAAAAFLSLAVLPFVPALPRPVLSCDFLSLDAVLVDVDFADDVVDVDVLENVDVGRTFVDPDPLTVFFVDTLGWVVGPPAGWVVGRQTHAHKKQ
jgi:hypothetical protein